MGKSFKVWYIYIISFCLVMTGLTTIKATSEDKKEAEAFRIAQEAYIYGYPLVLMDVTKKFVTNVTEPNEKGAAPINQFGHELTIPDPSSKAVVSLNIDTLYSDAFLDLTREPLVLHVPDTKGRYYLTPIMDAWSNVVYSPGKRTTGTQEKNFVIVGPNWKGPLPTGLPVIHIPTNMAWIAGRTQWNGPQDTAFVNEIQKGYTLTPLSSYGKPYTSPKNIPDPTIDMKISPMDQVNKMTPTQFFTQLAILMKNNPPAPADAPILKKMEKIGIVPGSFDLARLNPKIQKTIQRAPQAAMKKLKEQGRANYTKMGPWYTDFKGGQYGTDYARRAFTALTIFAENLAEDAIYATTVTDNEGKPLTGKKKYVLHFKKGELPPVNAFWSVTMYDQEHLLVQNPINRYGLGDRDTLKFNPDGSLDIYIQHEAPKKEKESNWLPSPEGPFNVILRAYWPKEELLNKTWQFPVIRQAS